MTIDPLLVDCYSPDGPKDWAAFVAAGPPWHAASFKLTQGTYYTDATWVLAQRAHFIASERYGVDLFDRMYAYLDLSLDGVVQCEYALAQEKIAGGALKGTLPLMLDVERGGQRQSSLSAARIVDTASAFARHYFEQTGRRCTLYAGELPRSFGITSHMECDRLAVARYTPTLPHDVVVQMGWDAPDEWQYCGDGLGFLGGYPIAAPGCGKIDISVVTVSGGIAALKALCG